MKSGTRSTIAILLGAASLIAVLLHLALRSDREFKEAPTLSRAPTAAPLRVASERLASAAEGQTLYVPVYSHVYGRSGGQIPLAVTLSIRNTDRERSILIDLLQYFGNDGELLKDYLEGPVILDPLSSADFLVEQRDMAGGVGANFLVDWVADGPVSLPIVEAVMVSSEGNRAFSFVRSGQQVAGLTQGE